jgi:hypothetical protein
MIYYTPKPYAFDKKIVDVDTIWYTITIHHPPAEEWLYEQPVGSWRYAANRPYSGFFERTMYDLREDVYNWFVLRWS